MTLRIEDVRRVAVLGAGTMGHGIAQVAAMAGWEVRLYDVSRELVDRGLARIADNLHKGVERGTVAPADADAARGRLSGTTSLEEAAAAAELVIEAIPEDLELKRRAFATLDRAAPPQAVLASNTSSLSVAAIASATARPARVVGMHFFNPAHIMKLVEVIRHEGSADDAVDLARAAAERMGKQPIVVRDVAGFASTRLGVLLGLEAIRMVEAGVAAVRDIDTAMKLGYGHPMGPLELGDHVGLDVRLAIAEYLERELGPAFRPPELLRRMVQDGRLGKKSGQGFYRWRDGKAVDG
jgi:3-hydroxybutyryl-CoA dehydrogenase